MMNNQGLTLISISLKSILTPALQTENCNMSTL